MANKHNNGWRGWAALASGLGAWGMLLLALWAPLAGAEPCPANIDPKYVQRFLYLPPESVLNLRVGLAGRSS